MTQKCAYCVQNTFFYLQAYNICKFKDLFKKSGLSIDVSLKHNFRI